MTVKIHEIQLENIKRVKMVQLEPTSSGLTIIGGNNRQGKTSVLDAITWALGGNKYRPSEPAREGSTLPPSLKIVLDNGLVVERKGKNSDLKVIDPQGQKAGQALLDSFISELALNLPKFLGSSSKDKAMTLLEIIGVGEQLYKLETDERQLYNKRHALGQLADQKAKWAKEQPHYPDAPEEIISSSELIRQQQEILLQNRQNEEKRQNVKRLQEKENQLIDEHEKTVLAIKQLQEKLAGIESERVAIQNSLVVAKKTAEELRDESTAELEANLAQIDEINIKVRANMDKEKAIAEAGDLKIQYDGLTEEIEGIRKERLALLNGAELPLPGLSVEDGELTYQGYKWDNMSGADQLIVATSIVRKLNPQCGFVLMDKLEQIDMDTLKAFGQWLEQEGLQVIATRVSKGDECTVIIEDGYAVGQEPKAKPAQQSWKEGEF